jgi:hypothetical protein
LSLHYREHSYCATVYKRFYWWNSLKKTESQRRKKKKSNESKARRGEQQQERRPRRRAKIPFYESADILSKRKKPPSKAFQIGVGVVPRILLSRFALRENKFAIFFFFSSGGLGGEPPEVKVTFVPFADIVRRGAAGDVGIGDEGALFVTCVPSGSEFLRLVSCGLRMSYPPESEFWRLEEGERTMVGELGVGFSISSACPNEPACFITAMPLMNARCVESM